MIFTRSFESIFSKLRVRVDKEFINEDDNGGGKRKDDVGIPVRGLFEDI